MSGVISARLKKEIKKMTTHPSEGISCCLRENSMHILDACVVGARGTPYEGGTFHLEISVPDKYPFIPPRVIFKTPIYHPNIDEGGRICLNVLKMPPSGAWRCTLTIENILTSVLALMSSPNPEDPLMPEIAEAYKTNRSAFEVVAKEWTSKYCSSKTPPQSISTMDNRDKEDTKPTKHSSSSSEGTRKKIKLQTLSDDSDFSD